jgi:hypothetical protein
MKKGEAYTVDIEESIESEVIRKAVIESHV